ncbi:MAG: OmpA family protein [Acidobacteria bacterium]|nr:OmpA family protein [Acidobacteriota bacterium]
MIAAYNSDMRELPSQTAEHKPERDDRARWLQILLLSLGLALIGFLGFLFFRQLQETERQMARLETQVRQAEEAVEAAGEASQAALARAAQAEDNAQQAALGRVQAEQAKAEAAQEAEQARQKADVATQQAQIAREEVEQIRQQREAEIERLQETLSKIAETNRTPLGLVMSLGSDSIRFDFDKSTLRPGDRELLSRIAGVLLSSYGFRIHVYGHTDDIGTEQYNQDLSERRARAVRDYLIEAGIDPEIMTTKGFGKTSPRVSGTDSEARAKNRSVEIGIIDSVIGYQGEVVQSLP